jgi:hypothetical protein
MENILFPINTLIACSVFPIQKRTFYITQTMAPVKRKGRRGDLTQP